MATLEQIAQAQADYLDELDSNINTTLSALETLAQREYGYTHTAIVTDDLEKDYQTITTANPSLADVSAVGLLAILKDGDTVTAQGNRLFIDDEEVVNPNGYTFSGTNSQNGIEIVKIWYFKNSDAVVLQDVFGFEVFNIVIKYDGIPNSINISANNVKVPFITVYGNYMIANTWYCKNLSYKNNTTNPYLRGNNDGPSRIINFYSEQRVLTASALSNNKELKRVYFPYLEEIDATTGGSGTYSGVFYECTALNVFKEDFPKLKIIKFTGNQSWCNPFKLVPYVEMPETVLEIGNAVFNSNHTIKLYCKNATNIYNNWYVGSACTVFELCSDWGASINIATAAGNWTLQQFIDCLNNTLRDMTLVNTTRTLTIPSAKLTDLQADTDGAAAIAAANAKGWTIGGA